MLRSKKVITASAFVAAGILGGGTVLTEGRALPHSISEAEMRSALIEKHGQDSSVYYDLSELPSLGEDGNCQGLVGQFRCFGVFDGHAGWCTSNYVSQNILTYLNESFARKANGYMWPFSLLKGSDKELSNDEIDGAIKDAFLRLDHDILQAPLKAARANDYRAASSALPLAASGSCAMMSFYHPARNLLKVALVGDSRTILGVQDSKGTWHAQNLTFDQTGATPSEIARIRAEHPQDNPNILRGGRILGFQPTRSFGDARTKYSKEQQEELMGKFWWRRPSPLLKTPPYMTALPVISTVQLDAKKPSLIVMGCDGLFEWLTNAQVVDLVGQWLDKNPVTSVKPYAGTIDQSNDGSAKDFLRPQGLKWGPLKPIVKDENVSTHLIRNALGGAEFEKVSMLMSIPQPTSRAYRDDITCTVVVFTPVMESKL